MSWVDLLEDELIGQTRSVPNNILDQAHELDGGYRSRPHLEYLSEALGRALKDVENGKSRKLIISMPPRSGKSLLTSQILPVWVLRKHPDWHLALVSHEANLAVTWGRQIRRWVEDNALGIDIAKDAGAVSEWETTKNGGVLSRSIGGSFIGRGARMMLIDDPIKDFVAAHSPAQREAVWNWWLTVAQTRLEPPSLVIVIMTRWHEDDLVGRLTSHEYEGDPAQWEVIKFPAIAEKDDVLGRSPGQPLYSPLLQETELDAVLRWDEVKTSVGSYAFNAMYQQEPSPAKGDIFDVDWWRFWTTDPQKANDRVICIEDPYKLSGKWVDSWDCAFKGTESSDYVVGQRWVRNGANRYLIDQQRGRWSFTQTLDRMQSWTGDGSPVHRRLVEDKANGTAVIDVLKDKVSGMIPINPTTSKTARARSITPEVESGNVFLPLPSDPGNDWVSDLLSECREFDHGVHDDQVDALTQALTDLRDAGKGSVHSPARSSRRVERNLHAVNSGLR